MSRPKGSKNIVESTPEELSLGTEERVDLIAALLIEIICEELCTTN